MKNRKLSQLGWAMAVVMGVVTVVISCSDDDQVDLQACGCTYYPELNQYLPNPLDADDVAGEDTYYSGKELRALNRECLERCE